LLVSLSNGARLHREVVDVTYISPRLAPTVDQTRYLHSHIHHIIGVIALAAHSMVYAGYR